MTALPLPPAGDRSVWTLGSGSADQPTLRDRVDRATADLDAPWPLPLASTAARVHRDGDRAAHEALVFGRQRRLAHATVAAAATLEHRYVDAVADGVLQLCEQSSWCWPAHDDTFAKRAHVLPDPDDPYLDLGAGDVVAQLAWTDHLLGAQLDEAYPGLRARVRRETRRRVFDPFVGRRDWHWIGEGSDVHNWNPWIHGNVLVGALRFLDGEGDAPFRDRVVDLAGYGLGLYLAALPPDGAVDEGYHYWWNGACRALEAAEILRHATDGALDPLATSPALRATVGFPHRMQLGDGWVLNLADGQARDSAEVAWAALHRAARRVGDDEAAAFAASRRRPGEPVANEWSELGRLLLAATDPAWVGVEPAPPPLPADVWLESIQVRLVRPSAGSAAGLTLAVKGGHNDEHHNHNDVGEVVVASDGVPVLVDAGRPTYTAETFGPNRYRLWMTQSAWHNVPLVRGTAQAVGRERRASTVEVLPDGLALDLHEAYDVRGLHSWRRTARLTDGVVTVRDAWRLDPRAGDRPEPRTVSYFLAAGAVTLYEGGATVAPLDGAPPVRMEWSGEIKAHVSLRPLDDPMLSSVWGSQLARIELDVTGREACEVVVRQVGP
ncbi:MAG: heparinase II/III family protein [Tessaracoccus sp.]|uniref:heparinase II/III domain-containing protein n=1 Tax=Tessaracoccus sp. TaxID=1971211 RepID=UPI001EB337C0|nr:heparinase II/III family protein [Tessaracoccus sp.]MBK7819975.1 heparinase II/III family protein [Tessaracoccus sp.]